MIQAEFFVNQQEDILSLKISGHAGFAKKGSDIVCAAISGQVAMLELGILAHQIATIKIEKRDGFFLIKEPSLQKEIQVLLKSFFLVLLATQKEYPQYVKININR